MTKSVNVRCNVCGRGYNFKIPKNTRTLDYLEKQKCPNCQSGGKAFFIINGGFDDRRLYVRIPTLRLHPTHPEYNTKGIIKYD